MTLTICILPAISQWHHLEHLIKKQIHKLKQAQCFNTKNDALYYKNWCAYSYEEAIKKKDNFCTIRRDMFLSHWKVTK